MFSEGEVVVYPGYGIGQIIGIEERVIENKTLKVYIFKPLQSETKIYIPLNSVSKIGIRPVISKEELPKVYACLTKKEVTISNEPWNKRYREYTEKLKSGNIFVLAELLRELTEVSKRKPLSFGEKKIYEKAKEHLVLELSICENCSPKEIELKIKEILNSI